VATYRARSALGAEAVTPRRRPQPPPATALSPTTSSGGRASTLPAGARRACRSRRAASTSRWTPTGSWPCFSLSHDRFQSADSAKYLIFSTRQFELPPDRPATFAVDLAVKNIGGEPGDFRRGMAAFHAFDLAGGVD
jgi:uncharacterized protein DUF6081